ncbi:MAG: TetR/AcrR family transcriptional regulator [Desulfobacteraceae bacterium]|nr:TetR/AcrR family transcriptional regulator [Desulfobacteraceae bacterium]MCF8094616.1 TetR/AcrR family transcriptional regulator [Desulfobacteraceae bacterium]
MGRKTAIINAATLLFAQKGFAETSTSEIAENAGVAQGTLFYHFKSKQGIIREIFSTAGSNFLSELRKALDSRDTGIEKIEAAIRLNEDFRLNHSQQILIFIRMFPDMKDTQSPERELVESLRIRSIEIIKNSLSAGREDGTIECSDVNETAWIINSLIFGILHTSMMPAENMPELTESAVMFCRRALKPSG